MRDSAKECDWAERMSRQDPEAVAWFARTFPAQLTAASDALRDAAPTIGVTLPAMLPLLAEAIGWGYMYEQRGASHSFEDYVASRHLSDLLLAAACLAEDGAAIGHLHVLIDGPVGRWLHRNQRDRASQIVVEEALMGLPAHLLAVITKSENAGRVRLATYRGRAPLLAWLRSSARSLLIDLIRRRVREKNQQESNLPPGDLHLDPARELEARELESLGRQLGKRFEELIERALAQMPPRRAVAARFRLRKRLRPSEIADLMSISRAAVSQHLDAARADVLRTVLGSSLFADIAKAIGIPNDNAERLLLRKVGVWFDSDTAASTKI